MHSLIPPAQAPLPQILTQAECWCSAVPGSSVSALSLSSLAQMQQWELIGYSTFWREIIVDHTYGDGSSIGQQTEGTIDKAGKQTSPNRYRSPSDKKVPAPNPANVFRDFFPCSVISLAWIVPRCTL